MTVEYARLSDQMLDYRRYMRQKGLTAADRRAIPIRIGSVLLAVGVNGEETVRHHPVYTNFAALALSQERLTVHRLSAEAIAQVRDSNVCTLPATPPRLLQGGWIIESARLSDPLFGAVVCLGGYSIGDTAWVIGQSYPDGMFVGVWRPLWGGNDIEGSYHDTLAPFVDADALRSLTIPSIEFAVTLGALMDAENSPLTERQERVETKVNRRTPAQRPPHPIAWSIRHVRLAPRTTTTKEPQQVGTKEREAPSRDGVHAEKRAVRGFLRRQVCGPGRADRKWVFVESFDSTRYIGDKPLRVMVQGGQQDGNAGK